ncbi:MAG: anthranilate synthase component 1 [Kangiellaceae bacterium]|jgi:anthranilate synthase component 1|nr:anthranilate synthase component 1 [Kangiellaceae bacterium]
MVETAAQTQTLSKQINHVLDVTSVFQRLTDDSCDFNALLETASITSKEHINSILALSAALRITCMDHRVDVIALNINGAQLLPLIKTKFGDAKISGSQLTILFDHISINNEVDEFKKLLLPSVFDAIRHTIAATKVNSELDKSTYLIGSFSFDCYDLFESLPKFDSEKDFPDYDFYLVDKLIQVNHQTNNSRIICKVFAGDNQQKIANDYQADLQSLDKEIHRVVTDSQVEQLNTSVDLAKQVNLNDDDYRNLVMSAKQNIINGDVFQLVVARHFTLACPDVMAAYMALRKSNPSPYMFYINTKDYQLFGASPESAVKYSAATNRASVYPIAGTRARGKLADGQIDFDLDARIELELKSDLKETAEHSMLVDLARNDIARVCKPGSRKIDRLMEVDRYSHVMHLVSKVSGELNSELDALSAYQACMNMGTLTGAPKIKASELIRHYETDYRGVYGGATGYLNAFGDMDTAIVIRSALVKAGVATVSAGAGIVYDSQPDAEALETTNKAAAVIAAIESTYSNNTNFEANQLSGEPANG